MHLASEAAPSAAAPGRWRQDDLGSIDRFVRVLGPDELADLERALATLAARGLDFQHTEASTLPLPVLDPVLHRCFEQVRDGAGFVLLRGLPVRSRTKDEIRAMSWLIACRFGKPVSQNGKGALVSDVMDVMRGQSSPRGYHSNAELRLHTDPASDLIGLCCIETAKEGGDSLLSNALAVYDELAAHHPQALAILEEGFPYHRFGEGLVDDPEITEYKVPVLSRVGDVVSCRFGSNRIRGAAEALGQAISEPQRAALRLFSDTATSPEFSIAFRMLPGDFLIANNLTLLHARTSFVDNDDPERPRHLLRYWLEAEGFRAIRPELNFFNRGRCGILARPQA